MRGTAIALLLTLCGLAALALGRGRETFLLGVRTSVEQLVHFLPVLVAAIFISGFTEVLLPRDLVERWLSDAAGLRGISLAWLAGILTPGGSIIGLPLVAALYKAGVGISVLMTYATSFSLLSILRVPIEVSFYGWSLTGIRLLVSLILPFVAGMLTQLLLPFLKG